MIDHFLMERTQSLGLYLQRERALSLPWILAQTVMGVIVLGVLYYLYFFRLLLMNWTGETPAYNFFLGTFFSMTWLPILWRRWRTYREYRADSLNYDPVMVDKYYIKSSLNRVSDVGRHVRWIFLGISTFLLLCIVVLFLSGLADPMNWSGFGLFLSLFLSALAMLFQEYMECVPPVPPKKKEAREASFQAVGEMI